MSYGKIIGYALAGVSALAGTYIFGKDSGKKVGKKEGREDGYKEARAQHANEINSLKLKMALKLKDIAKRDDFVLCAYGLGLSYLYANGSLSAEKSDTLSDLVIGIGKTQTLSQQTQQ